MRYHWYDENIELTVLHKHIGDLGHKKYAQGASQYKDAV